MLFIVFVLPGLISKAGHEVIIADVTFFKKPHAHMRENFAILKPDIETK